MIKKWSYSRWCLYHSCPKQYEGRYILKMDKFISSYAIERGLDIHAKAENYVNGKIKGLPRELRLFKDEFLELKREYIKGNGSTEPDISMNINKTPSTRKKSNWFVGFADYKHQFNDELTVIDYKTGNEYPTHKYQGDAYTTALLCMNKKVKKIKVEFWYLDSGNVVTFNYTQRDTKKMFDTWKKRIDKMYSTKLFKKKPHKYCYNCFRNVKNGGDCSA